MRVIDENVCETMPEIFSAYGITEPVKSKIIRKGHINRTFIIEFSDSGKNEKRILQQINTTVFKNPAELMDNIMRVTEFLKKKIAAEGGDVQRETLSVFLTKDGKNCYIDKEGCCWRIYNFIDDASSYNSIDNDELFLRAGAAFGKFQAQLADFPIETLYDTIPDFHNTYKRFLNLKASHEKNLSGRAGLVAKELEFAYAREADTKIIVDAIEKGIIPLRVTHNDTKLNNIMFDNKTDLPICVVDLDTVMSGSALYDFGDAVRFGTNTGAEDEKDLSLVSVDLNLYEKYVRGYLSTAGKSLTPAELEYLPFSAKLLTYECGIRFLTDYIDGDVYFGTEYPEHNLVRCRTQFKLVADMEEKFEQMQEITKKAVSEVVNK